jgi:hypothetical protein
MSRSQSAQASSDNSGLPGCTQNSGPAAHTGVAHRSSTRRALNHRIRTSRPEKVRSQSVQCRFSSQSAHAWCGSRRWRIARRRESEFGERRMGSGQSRLASKIARRDLKKFLRFFRGSSPESGQNPQGLRKQGLCLRKEAERKSRENNRFGTEKRGGHGPHSLQKSPARHRVAACRWGAGFAELARARSAAGVIWNP